MPDGTILAANPAACRMFRRSEEELRQIGRDGIVDYSDSRFFEATDERKQLRTYSEKEYTHIRKDGTRFPSEVSSGIFVDKEGHERTITIIRDITRRRQAEEEIRKLNEELEERVIQRTAELTKVNEALKKSEATLSSVLSASPVGILHVTPDRKISWMNDRMTSITGYKLEDIEDRNPRIFYPTEEEFARVGKSVFQRVAQGNSIEADTQWVRKDGQIRDIHLSVAPIDPDDTSAGQVSAVTDITEQKEAQKKLIESEERYRTVIEYSNDGVVLTQNNKHVYVNQRYLKIFGYDRPEEILGKPIAITVHPDDLEMVLNHVRKRISGETTSAQYTFRGIRKDGSTNYVEVSGATMLYNGELATIGFFRDVTARKLAEEALRESENKFRDLAEKANVGIFIASGDGLLRYVNTSFAQIHDYEIEELVDKKNALDLLLPEDLPAARKEVIASMTAGEKSLHQEFRIVTKAGEIRHVETHTTQTTIQGKSAVIGTVIDVTERKKAEVALMASEERFRHLLESVTDYIYTVKIENSRPVSTTHGPGCVAITGYTSQEYSSDPYLWYRMVHEEDRGIVADRTAQFFLGYEVFPLEHRIVHKDGSVRWVRNTLVPRRDDTGCLVAYDGLITDITEQKKFEEDLKASEDRFRTLILKSEEIISLSDINHKHSYVSPSVKNILGYSPDEYCNLGWPDICHPDDIKILEENRNWMLEHPGETISSITRRRHKDGSWRWVESTARNLLDHPHVQAIVVNYHDITKRMDAEEQLECNLRETSVRFEVSQALAGNKTEEEILDVFFQQLNIYKDAQIAIGICETIDGQLFSIARRIEVFSSGIPAAIPLGTRFSAIQFQGMQKYVVNNTFLSENIATDERIEPISREILLKQGVVTYAFFEIGAGDDFMGVIVAESKKSGYFDKEKQHLYRTIAEQGAIALRAARLREAIHASQQRLSLLVDQSPIAIIEWNLNLEVVSWNPAATRIFGYEREEALARHAIGLLLPQTMKQNLEQSFQNLFVEKATSVS